MGFQKGTDNSISEQVLLAFPHAPLPRVLKLELYLEEKGSCKSVLKPSDCT